MDSEQFNLYVRLYSVVDGLLYVANFLESCRKKERKWNKKRLNYLEKTLFEIKVKNDSCFGLFEESTDPNYQSFGFFQKIGFGDYFGARKIAELWLRDISKEINDIRV
ncbi:hypothetical protein COU58_00450 [Candidatus Pacearchaeota archaeon CG10_big_fil_rev_8_21_14_0_10_32_42]|nr:MAG: hypothetical protein COU58_00450 [Candidatus Pacearchaeota archaeon CG10_big_fil_rev_8_21_14_0_10_32_42]